MHKRPAVFLVFLVLFGCARGIDYNALGNNIRSGECQAAVDLVKEENYGKNQRLLYLLDAAQVNMICGNYEKSNDYFHEAEDLAEDLWTRSVTKETAAFLTSDYTIPYRGEDFERVLINLLSALNYAMLGQYDEALVECKRLDANLNMYNDKYETKNVYKEDAFGRYISGLLYEATGSMDDAYIDYYKSYRVFQDYDRDYGTAMPPALVEDLLRTARATDRQEELVSEPGLDKPVKLSHKEASQLGKIVLVHFNGLSPVKIEDSIMASTPRGPIKIAFPKYVQKKPACSESELVASGDIRARAALFEDINGIAVKNLDDRKGRVIAKTIARAIVKQVAINKVARGRDNKASKDATKVVFNILNLALERADTRTWKTLPGEIYLARLYVPGGDYDLGVRMCGGSIKPLKKVTVKPGETKFVMLHTMY
jgi:hypothetical protein